MLKLTLKEWLTSPCLIAAISIFVLSKMVRALKTDGSCVSGLHGFPLLDEHSGIISLGLVIFAILLAFSAYRKVGKTKEIKPKTSE